MNSIFHPPSSTEQIGTFNNIPYVRYKGKFTGRTDCRDAQGNGDGSFAVPYEITTPSPVPPRGNPGGGNQPGGNPAGGKHIFVVEPPHFASGIVARDDALGPKFLFNRGFSHVSVGYSNFAGCILDPDPGFPLKICGQDLPKDVRITDIHIFQEAAETLRRNPPNFLGKVERLYSIGFSQSGDAVHAMYAPFGHKLFDITFACIANYLAPVKIRGQKPILVFNTEFDFNAAAQPNPEFPQYRWYGVAGGAHIPDARLSRLEFTDPPQPGSPAPPVAGTSPINWLLFIRALFMAGHRWVVNGVEPPPSTTLKVDAQGNIARDARCNALGGIRHPALENGEATFVASIIRGNAWNLFGGYGKPRRLLDAAEFAAYLESFTKATEALLAAKFLLPAGRARLLREAQLNPPDTYTRNYMFGRLFPPTLSDEDEDE